jgi:hypothetical protein
LFTRASRVDATTAQRAIDCAETMMNALVGPIAKKFGFTIDCTGCWCEERGDTFLSKVEPWDPIEGKKYDLKGKLGPWTLALSCLIQIARLRFIGGNCGARFIAWYGTDEDTGTEVKDVEKCGLSGCDRFKRDTEGMVNRRYFRHGRSLTKSI